VIQLGKIFFASDIFKPQKPYKPNPLKPINAQIPQIYGDSRNPKECVHTVKAWMHLNDKYETKECVNCGKLFQLRNRNWKK